MNGLKETLIAWGPLGVLALAIIESAGLPTPSGTDALIILLAIARPDEAWLLAVLGVVGSLIGSTIFHGILSKGGEKLLDRYTSSKRGKKVKAWFQRYGLASVFICALVPLPVMPMKLVAASACALGVTRLRYLATIAAARIPRYIAMAYLGAQLGQNSTQWLSDHKWDMGIGTIILTVALFLLLKISERMHPAKANPVEPKPAEPKQAVR